MMKRAMKKWISSLLILVLCIGFLPSSHVGNEVSAETKTESTTTYMTGTAFVKYLVKKLKLEVKKEKNPYLNAAYRAGIYEPSDIASLDSPITIAEISVLLNRADEYLHGDTLEESYVKMILEKRISDIATIDKDKREAVAKVYGKGIIKGYSDGMGVKSRSFRGDTPVSVKAAKAWVNFMMNPSKRYPLSPDGLLIRTTNLPKNADKYEYILACYPNEFYERKFFYEFINSSSRPIIEGERYIFPVNVRRDGVYRSFYNDYKMSEQMDLYLYDWADYLEKYVYQIFNVNYKTIGQEWMDAVTAVCAYTPQTESSYQRYIKDMKNYGVVVETRKIAVEPSTLYFSDHWYMRVYVEFKVTAKEAADDFGLYVFSKGGEIRDLKLDKWMTGYFDISFGTIEPFWSDASSVRPTMTLLYGW